MAVSVNKNSLINEIQNNALDVFKLKADELTELASHIPHIHSYDAKIYFYQHCDALIELLDIERKYDKENNEAALDKDSDHNILEVKDRLTVLDVKAMCPEKTDTQTVRKVDISNLSTDKNKTCSDELENSNQDFAPEERMSDLREISRDKLDGHDIVVQSFPPVINQKRTLYNDDDLEIFCESMHKEEKQPRSNDANIMEILPENQDEAVDNSSHHTIDNSNIDAQPENIEGYEDTAESGPDVECDTPGQDMECDIPGQNNECDMSTLDTGYLISGQDLECDITELIKCIPKLSQYMDIDPKNVTVLKDGVEGEDDECIHLSVELSDGTVQKFKIAGYIPSVHGTTGSMSLENGETENTLLEQKDIPQNTGIHDNTGSGLSILSRRLRTRQHKGPVVRRGPGRPKNENIPEPEKNEKGETFYRCEECRATVKSYNALIVHMRTHTGSRPFHCSFCNKSFTTKGNMKAHETTTHSDSKPWKCEYCGKSFKEKKVLKIHERIHTGLKPYSCNICDKAFSQRSVMLEHMFIHSNNRPHLCDYCGQGFRGLSSLKAHKKRHLGLREFQCDSCEKAFVCKNELKRHMLTHTGEKPYSCHICLKAFTRHSYLKEHINLHTGARPYTCIECNVTFSDSMSLHRHKKKHEADGARFIQKNENEGDNVTDTTAGHVATNDKEQSLMLEIPENLTLGGEQTSIQVVVDENTSVEDFQKLHSLLLSATGNGEMMMNSQDAAKHLYQVLCVNPDTQEVLGQVEGQEVIVEGQSGDVTQINLQYNG